MPRTSTTAASILFATLVSCSKPAEIGIESAANSGPVGRLFPHVEQTLVSLLQTFNQTQARTPNQIGPDLNQACQALFRKIAMIVGDPSLPTAVSKGPMTEREVDEFSARLFDHGYGLLQFFEKSNGATHLQFHLWRIDSYVTRDTAQYIAAGCIPQLFKHGLPGHFPVAVATPLVGAATQPNVNIFLPVGTNLIGHQHPMTAVVCPANFEALKALNQSPKEPFFSLDLIYSNELGHLFFGAMTRRSLLANQEASLTIPGTGNNPGITLTVGQVNEAYSDLVSFSVASPADFLGFLRYLLKSDAPQYRLSRLCAQHGLAPSTSTPAEGRASLVALEQGGSDAQRIRAQVLDSYREILFPEILRLAEHQPPR